MTTRAKSTKAKDKAAEPAKKLAPSPLITKYRPRSLKEVVGQQGVVKSLLHIVDAGTACTFLFSGPSGTGKTTLARIAADMFECAQPFTEIDAATNTGIDDMRRIQDLLNYRPFGELKARAVIIDEAHMLSKQAWNSLLKVLEEPPPDVYFFICTTELGKVPATIKTRAAAFTLQAVTDKELFGLLGDIADDERISVSDDVLDICVREAHGSPRQAISNLAQCSGAASAKEAASILQTVQNSDQVIELCRFLVQGGGSWAKMMGFISAMGDDVNPESVRIIICNYLASCIKGARNEKDVPKFLNLLEAFGTSYNASEKMAPLYLSLGRVMF